MVKKEEKRPRGRPRAYDPERAMDRATGAFWRAGYSATSLEDLTAATGMNKPSLYAAFGDKRAFHSPRWSATPRPGAPRWSRRCVPT